MIDHDQPTFISSNKKTFLIGIDKKSRPHTLWVNYGAAINPETDDIFFTAITYNLVDGKSKGKRSKRVYVAENKEYLYKSITNQVLKRRSEWK
jgi:hypothetical protein